MRSKIVKYLGLSGGALFLIFAFQNCAKDLPQVQSGTQSSAAGGLRQKFYVGSAKQGAPLQTIGTTWTNVPGAELTFNLAKGMDVDLKANGSASYAAGTNYTASAHCGFRFVVDGVPYGNPIWGDAIVHVASWSNWTATRSLPLAAGNHIVQLQQTGWPGADSACSTNEADYSAARLHVEAF